MGGMLGSHNTPQCGPSLFPQHSPLSLSLSQARPQPRVPSSALTPQPCRLPVASLTCTRSC